MLVHALRAIRHPPRLPAAALTGRSHPHVAARGRHRVLRRVGGRTSAGDGACVDRGREHSSRSRYGCHLGKHRCRLDGKHVRAPRSGRRARIAVCSARDSVDRGCCPCDRDGGWPTPRRKFRSGLGLQPVEALSGERGSSLVGPRDQPPGSSPIAGRAHGPKTAEPPCDGAREVHGQDVAGCPQSQKERCIAHGRECSRSGPIRGECLCERFDSSMLSRTLISISSISGWRPHIRTTGCDRDRAT